MNTYIIVREKSDLSVKFYPPPLEVLQTGAKIFACAPSLEVGYICYWVELGCPNTDLIQEVLPGVTV